ncbi:ATP-dependent RNA helicase SUV3 [Aspergillus karnatakaensis]|uniref:ATP-dependent RNA helicase SUV3 n=1 Tax=Aspergillus karnatakaensis TaxID=1810916 RepID=UPI003CCD9532
MQQWASQGSRCLLRGFQASLSTVGRTFATTPALGRSAKSKKSLEKTKQKAALDETKSPRTLQPVRQTLLTGDFQSAVDSILKQLKDDPIRPHLTENQWAHFERHIKTACKVEDKSGVPKAGSLRHTKITLQRAFVEGRAALLARELELLMHSYETNIKFSLPHLEQQKKIADLRFPSEWYPQARATQRTIHLHVGPTNSGKTYHALKRLEASKSGFYAGPLRLLAQEVHQRFQSSGIPCSLVTGDDVKIPEGVKSVIVSNTVEMVNIGEPYEVGVIDEIQMISDPNRGWAWTRVLLGSRAKELHLCGETRSVPLIRELAALNGDKLEIHRYERLNPLKVEEQSLNGDLKKLRKGDCVVAFSRIQIHALKADIEKLTGRRAAIVYGGLPAEIRTQQASLFNDPDNDYDFLVASDAIGMGLNLSIKRIIFETLVKRLPTGLVRLSVPEIKQIGGRAGRYRPATQHNDSKSQKTDDSHVGYITAFEEVDLPWIRQALDTEPPPLTAAGVVPPDSVYEKFGAYFPRDTPLEYLVKRLAEISEVGSLFFMCDAKSQAQNAAVIDIVPGLQLADQLTFMAAPIHVRDQEGRDVATALAHCVAEHTDGRLLDVENLNLEVLEEPVSGSKEYLRRLESLHNSVILYNWLSFRFGGVFTDRTLAVHVKEMVEERMVRALAEFSANKKLQKNLSLRRQIALQKQILEQKQFITGFEEDLTSEHYSPDAMEAANSESSIEVDLADSKDLEEKPSNETDELSNEIEEPSNEIEEESSTSKDDQGTLGESGEEEPAAKASSH